jgi:glycosyltransferase involved in cell wall biosynthesis
MRIAFVTLGYTPLRMSGLDISGERLVRGLLEAGHHVTVIAGARGLVLENHVHPALEIHRARLGNSNWIGFAYRAAQLLQKLDCIQPFDLIHFWDVHFAYAYAGPFVASLHQSFRQRWSIWRWGNNNLLSNAYRFAYYTLARCLAEMPCVCRARGLLAVSTATRDEFIRHYGVAPERIALTRHGIDADYFRRTPEANALRSKLGLSPEEPVILFVGFVTPRKGLDYLARALPKIRPSPRLIIVGCWSEPHRSHFLHTLGALACQVVEAGFVPDAQMPAYYSLADVYVSPALLEGFGLPLAESLACETPVVTADAGSATEVIGPGGILVPPGDPAAIANAVSQLLNDPSRRREMGMLGRQHVEREFSIRGMLYSVLDAYQRFR